MTSPMFSASELETLGQSGLERMQAAIHSDDHDRIKTTFQHVIALYHEEHVLFHGWLTSIIAYASEKLGHQAAKHLVPMEALFSNFAGEGVTMASVRPFFEDPLSIFTEKLEHGDTDGAFEFYRTVERGARDLHDFYRDYCALMLTRLYREHGIDHLNDCLRYSATRDWLAWYESVNKLPDKERIIRTIEFYAIANFGRLTVREDGDWIHAVQNPCGSCGRQQRSGRYESPWNFAVIEEEHPLSFEMGGNTIYRAHVAMMHHILPIERHGGPWPHKQCPRSKYGRCYISIHKYNPYEPIPREEIRWSD